MLTAERLRELLSYDPETGWFTWRVTRSSNGRADAGSRAGALRSDGYRHVTVDQHKYKEHRLAWLYMTGKWPEADLDHKNNTRDDNRFSNLRAAS